VIRPLDPVTSKQRAAYGFAFFVLFVALWAWATFGGYVSKTFLANPLTMLQEGWELAKHGFLFDIGMTIWRVLGGFVLAAIIAVPLGVLMGAYKPIEAFLEPFVSFARYLPASAFIPLLILWAGIGELQKLLVIFIGSVFQIILMIAVNVGTRGAILLRPRTRWAPATAASSAVCCCPRLPPRSRKSFGSFWVGRGPTSSSPNSSAHRRASAT
jgi:NitT/TauT family transport system permease protein